MNIMDSKSFLKGSILGCLGILALYIGLFFLSFGPYENDLISMRYIQPKIDLVKNIKGPKLVIVSGSNGQYGLDAHLMREKLTIPVINSAINAGIDWFFYDKVILKNLDKGDIALLPLESQYFSNKQVMNTTTVKTAHNLSRNFFLSLPLEKKIEYIRLLNPKFIIDTIKKRYITPLYKKKKKKDFYEAFIAAIQEYGDIDARVMESAFTLKREEFTSFGGGGFDGIPSVCSSIKSLKDRGIKVIVTEPNYFPLPEEKEKYLAYLNKVRNLIEECGAEYISVPNRGILNYEDLLDSQYHPKYFAKINRTKEFLITFCQINTSLCRSPLK